MLDLSHALNPDCTQVLADTRLLELQDRFDVGLAQDAIDYMLPWTIGSCMPLLAFATSALTWAYAGPVMDVASHCD